MYGNDISEFSVEVKVSDLKEYVLNNMNRYWAYRIEKLENTKGWDRKSRKMVDEEIEWTVLGILRQFYTLEEGDVISKKGAGNYGLRHLDEPMHGIIKEALSIREETDSVMKSTNGVRIDKLITLTM